MSIFRSLVLLVNVLLPSFVYAASQGTLGTTTTGTVNVSITIPALEQVTGFTDLTVASASSFPVTTSTTACIYSNVSSPLGSYFVTASSLNASTTDFRIMDSVSGSYITYSAYWNNAAAASPTTTLASGTKTAQQTGGSSTSLTCGGSPNANFNINLTASEVEGAPAATYSDVVTIVISPT